MKLKGEAPALLEGEAARLKDEVVVAVAGLADIGLKLNGVAEAGAVAPTEAGTIVALWVSLVADNCSTTALYRGSSSESTFADFSLAATSAVFPFKVR